MASSRLLIWLCAGSLTAGCADVLPKPEYTLVKYPSPIRTEPDGTHIDNRGYPMDAAGYRLDKKTGQIVGFVDYDAKTAGEESNAIAGYYVSSTGTISTGTVAQPSMGAKTGAGYGVGSANPAPSGMGGPGQGPAAPPLPSSVTVPASPPPNSTDPIPIAPPATRQ
jgi:hypothetical protein